MGKWGRERVVAEFSIEKLAERLETEIKGMLEKPGRPPLMPFAAVILAIGLMGGLAATSIILVLNQPL
jgi:alpha-1,3/alpha-1,6-mannosyltransferase